MQNIVKKDAGQKIISSIEENVLLFLFERIEKMNKRFTLNASVSRSNI
jgi:hypothetical protein